MITLQMLQDVGNDEDKRVGFVGYVISSHKASEDYKYALIAQDYDKRRNTTITNYRKLLYTISGDTLAADLTHTSEIAAGMINGADPFKNRLSASIWHIKSMSFSPRTVIFNSRRFNRLDAFYKFSKV